MILPSQAMILAALDLATVVFTIGLGYYAAKIFFHMRLGRLENGWKMMTSGIISLCFGFVFLTFQHLVPRESNLYFYLDSVGTILSIIGIVLMMLGLRSHYLVWTRKKSAAPLSTSHSDESESDVSIA
jgi:nicotinamide riboside transporter PnuC